MGSLGKDGIDSMAGTLPAVLVSLSASLVSDAWVVICVGMLSMVSRSAILSTCEMG